MVTGKGDILWSRTIQVVGTWNQQRHFKINIRKSVYGTQESRPDRRKPVQEPGRLLFCSVTDKNTICVLPKQSRQGNNPCCQVGSTKSQGLQCTCWPNPTKNEFTDQHLQWKCAHPHTAGFSPGSRMGHMSPPSTDTRCQGDTFCTHSHLQGLPAQLWELPSQLTPNTQLERQRKRLKTISKQVKRHPRAILIMSSVVSKTKTIPKMYFPPRFSWKVLVQWKGRPSKRAVTFLY